MDPPALTVSRVIVVGDYGNSPLITKSIYDFVGASCPAIQASSFCHTFSITKEEVHLKAGKLVGRKERKKS